MVTHNCPFLENGKFCTYKRCGGNAIKDRAKCSYKTPLKCDILREAKSEIGKYVLKQKKRTGGLKNGSTEGLK